MIKLTDEQTLFFETLQEIQDLSIFFALSENKDKTNIEDILLYATYYAIYSVMELLDGYENDNLQFEITSKKTNKSLRESIELHDTCASFLKYSK